MQNQQTQDFKVLMEKESKSLASKLDLSRLHVLVSRVDIRVFQVPFDHLLCAMQSDWLD